jgi:hypothetical protein
MSNPPVSVRVTRFLLWCGLIGGGLILLVWLWARIALPGGWALVDAPPIDWTAIATLFLTGAIALSLVGFALWGIQHRKPYGRWLSVMFLVILVVASLTDWDQSGAIRIILKALIRGQLPPIEGKLIDDFAYDNSYPIYRGYLDLVRHASIDALSLLLLIGIPGFLAIRLIFSPEVKRFFSRS